MSYVRLARTVFDVGLYYYDIVSFNDIVCDMVCLTYDIVYDIVYYVVRVIGNNFNLTYNIVGFNDIVCYIVRPSSVQHTISYI